MSLVAFYTSSLARRSRWVESLAIVGGATAAGFALFRSDPFLLRAEFPWLLFVPLLCGLQHGLGPALAGTSLMIASAAAHAWWAGTLSVASFASWALGCVFAGALSGEFRDQWAGRRHALSGDNDALRKHNERLRRAHQLSSLSHARLERQLQAQRWSLDSCLRDAGRRIASAASMAERGAVVLDVFAAHGSVQAASLYTRGPRGSLQAKPVAALGSGRHACNAEHPLVQRAFSSARLVSIVHGGSLPHAGDAVLAAVPLVNARQEVVAVLAIQHMPFNFFQAEHLGDLMVLGAQLADMLQDAPGTQAREAATRLHMLLARSRRAGLKPDPASSHALLDADSIPRKPRSAAPN